MPIIPASRRMSSCHLRALNNAGTEKAAAAVTVMTAGDMFHPLHGLGGRVALEGGAHVVAPDVEDEVPRGEDEEGQEHGGPDPEAHGQVSQCQARPRGVRGRWPRRARPPPGRRRSESRRRACRRRRRRRSGAGRDRARGPRPWPGLGTRRRARTTRRGSWTETQRMDMATMNAAMTAGSQRPVRWRRKAMRMRSPIPPQTALTARWTPISKPATERMRPLRYGSTGACV